MTSFYRRIKKIHFVMKDSEIQIIESSLAFSFLLSLIPFLVWCFFLMDWSLIFEGYIPKVEELILTHFQGSLGQDGIKIFHKILTRVQLSKLGIVGAGFLIFASFKLLYDIDFGIHRIWKIKNNRSWPARLVMYFAITLGVPIIFTFATLILQLKGIPVLSPTPAVIKGGVFLFLVLFFINYMIPNTNVRLGPSIVGSLFSSGLLILLQWFFAWATKYMFNYSKIYGSIAAFPALMLWTLILWKIILLGVAMTASYHQDTEVNNNQQ